MSDLAISAASRFSVFLKHLIGRDTLRLGTMPFRCGSPPTCLGLAQPLRAGRRHSSGNRRSSLYAFIGASATAMPAPFVNALHQDQAIGVVQAERTLSPTLRLTTHALFSSRQTVLQGIKWERPSGVEAGATVGVGGNQPYGSASMALKHDKVDLRMAYVGMGDHFRRTGVPSPMQSEADRENVLLTLRPAEGFSLGIGRQNFRQDSTASRDSSRATSIEVFCSARIFGSSLAAGLFDSRTPGTRSASSYVSASRDITRWLQTDLYLLRVWSPTPARSTTPILHLREFITPRASLLQVVTHASGRTTVAFGGAFAIGLTTIGVDYQVIHTPYRPRAPFAQTIALNVRVPLGNYRVSAASFVTPDGRVNYTGSASTFFYAGDVLGGGNRPVEIKFERYIVEGTVVDESGVAVEGAAIDVGASTVFTDSRGRFFVRRSLNRRRPSAFWSMKFLAVRPVRGRVGAGGVTPSNESTPVRIVVRRVPSGSRDDRFASGSIRECSLTIDPRGSADVVSVPCRPAAVTAPHREPSLRPIVSRYSSGIAGERRGRADSPRNRAKCRADHPRHRVDRRHDAGSPPTVARTRRASFTDTTVDSAFHVAPSHASSRVAERSITSTVVSRSIVVGVVLMRRRLRMPGHSIEARRATTVRATAAGRTSTSCAPVTRG
jgi:hypothetical protein